MSRPGQYEMAALDAWTPAQQAATRAMRVARQAERDVEEATKKAEDEARREAKKSSLSGSPQDVSAGVIVNDLIKSWCPPLYSFLDVFCPPYIGIAVFVGAHGLFLHAVPWYLTFLWPWAIVYLIPAYCSCHSLYDGKDRTLWQSYWFELSVLEWMESLLFGDRIRILIWWPVLKTTACFLAYCALKSDRKGRPVFGAVILITPALKLLESKDSKTKK